MRKNLKMRTSPKQNMTKPESLNDEYDEESLGENALDLEEDI
jgi:hypothetical protein